MADSKSVTGILLSCLPATERCKVRPCAMGIHRVDLPGAFRLNTRSLHNETADSNSVNGALFSSFPAFQLCKVRLYATDIHEVPFCYESGFYHGAFRLDAGFLHNQTANSNSVTGALFSSFP